MDLKGKSVTIAAASDRVTFPRKGAKADIIIFDPDSALEAIIEMRADVKTLSPLDEAQVVRWCVEKARDSELLLQFLDYCESLPAEGTVGWVVVYTALANRLNLADSA